ncbi:MAG: hypothetical protein AB1942_01630 [Pseudomonadota bacterium]
MLTAALAILAAATGLSAATGLAGDWVVDLSTRSQPSYTQSMVLRLDDSGVVTGTFYNSEIQAGRWKTDRGRTCASFRTTDGAGPYHTSVCLDGARAVGQTWAEHRNFLFNWNADRKIP